MNKQVDYDIHCVSDGFTVNKTYTFHVSYDLGNHRIKTDDFTLYIHKGKELRVNLDSLHSVILYSDYFTLGTEIINSDNLLLQGELNHNQYNRLCHDLKKEFKALKYKYKRGSSYLELVNASIQYDLIHEPLKTVPIVDKFELIKNMLYVYSVDTVIHFIKERQPIF